MDHVARAGRTFRYTADGPEGLLKGKRAVLIFTRGGHYVGTAADQQSAYLRQFLAFIGITDLESIYAEGLALGAEAKTTSLALATRQAQQLLQPALAA
jgi:FMN-dependent NADH-azoreductase